MKENDWKVWQQNEKNSAMARKDSRTKERLLCICVCVHFNIKDVLTFLFIINEGKIKIKYKKRNSNCIVTSKRQK